MAHKYGLKPVLEQPRVKLRDYYTSDLPSVDSLKFPLGHANLVKPQMFMNDTIGDCAIAGSFEEIRLANALRGVTVNFTDETAVENYSALTGYDPADPSTDQGADVHDLYTYRKSTGLVDADGKRHKVIAYAGLTVGDWDELLIALSMFDMVSIGLACPDYIQAQFTAGDAWHLLPGRHAIEGGHFVTVWGASDANTGQLPTWGGDGAITAPFFNAYNLVTVVGLTTEMFTGDKSPEGIDFEKLQADLPEFNTGTVSLKAPKGKLPKATVSVDGVDMGPGKIGTRSDDAQPGEQIGGFDAEPAH